MFANNEKISVRQLGRMLCLDWTAKLCFLLPVLLTPLFGWNQIFALALGIVWSYVYAWMLGNLSGKMKESFTGYMSERLGRYAARTAGIFFYLYLLVSQVYLARAAGKVCGIFLLPEMRETVIAILFLAAGLAAAAGSVQKRARAAQCLYPVAAVMLIVMLAASADSVKMENLYWSASFDPGGVFIRSGCVFAVFSGMGLVLYEVPYIRRTGISGSAKGQDTETGKPEIGKAVRKSLIYTAVFMIAVFVIMLGAFGKEELRQLPWPVLVLMSNVNVPGGFLQRWDIVFLSVLLVSLLTAAGTGIHYMERILGEVFPTMKKEVRPYYVTIISVAAVLIVGSYETAEAIFVRWALCAMTPLMTAVPVLLWILEKVSSRCRRQRSGREAKIWQQ